MFKHIWTCKVTNIYQMQIILQWKDIYNLDVIKIVYTNSQKTFSSHITITKPKHKTNKFKWHKWLDKFKNIFLNENLSSNSIFGWMQKQSRTKCNQHQCHSTHRQWKRIDWQKSKQCNPKSKKASKRDHGKHERNNPVTFQLNNLCYKNINTKSYSKQSIT